MSLEEFNERVLESKDPLVGLRYLIYIEDGHYGIKVDPYVCMLCTRELHNTSKKGCLNNILQHVKSRAHQKRFLEIEFSSIYEKIENLQKDPGE